MPQVEPVYAAIGPRLKTARERAQLTQQALADQIGLKRAAVSNIETGSQRLLLHTFLDIATALRRDPVDLLSEVTAANGDFGHVTTAAPLHDADKEFMRKLLGEEDQP